MAAQLAALEKQLTESEKKLSAQTEAVDDLNDEIKCLKTINSLKSESGGESSSQENIPIARMLLGDGLKVLEWNNEAEKVFGFSQKEALASDVLRLIVPRKDRPRTKEMFAELKKQIKAEKRVAQSYTKDREIITCEWHYLPDESGSFVIAYAYKVEAKEEPEPEARKTLKRKRRISTR